MKDIARALGRFVREEKGLETVEYAIVAALITVAAITAITAVGTNVATMFTNLANNLK